MYKDPSQPVERRIEDLVRQMTLEEKVAQLGGIMPLALLGQRGVDPQKMKKFIGGGIGQISMLAMFGSSQIVALAERANQIQRFLVENTRLGIPTIVHNEALSGFVAPQATNFPTPIGLAATWEPELIENMADVIRRQTRTVGVHQALSPVLDVARDPRWGRIHETYGEDPYLISSLGTAYVKGLQGADLKDGVIATAKHFLGYGLTEGGLNTAATHLGGRDLYEAFARPFEAAIRDAGMGSIMNSYSEIDGVPVGSSKRILTDLLRGRMGFTGFVVSDYWTITWFVTKFGTAVDLQEAGVQAITAGLDVELPNAAGYGSRLVEAVRKGLVSEDVIDQSVRRVLEAKFRLGLFEQPYVDTGKIPAVYDAPENRQLSTLLAHKSMTLLKNEGHLLPLTKDIGSIAVIGPHADSVRLLFGNYTFPASMETMRSMILEPGGEATGMMDAMDEGIMDGDTIAAIMQDLQDVLAADSIDAYIKAKYPVRSVLEAIRATVSGSTQVHYAEGCGVVDESTAGFEAAVEAADKADVAVLILGDRSGWIEATTGEGKDRTSLDLPGVQEQLLEAVCATGTPVVLVLVNGRPLSVNWAAEHVPAILEAWYPGQEGGDAIASVLFGDYNPGGKLPVTVARNAGQVPIYHYHKAGSGYQRSEGEIFHGYTDVSGDPLYPFGFGLSYTQFEYSNLRLSASQVDSRGAVEISCDVTNVGQVAGDEVAQLYLHDREATVTRPVQELAGFKRVSLEPGARCTVTFRVQMSQLGFLNRDMQFVVEPGNVDVMIGSSSADVHLTGEFEITGDVVDVAGKRSFTCEAKVTGQEGIPFTIQPSAWSPPQAPRTEIPEPVGEEAEAVETGDFYKALTAVAERLERESPEKDTTIKFDIKGEGIYRLIIADGKCRVVQGDGEATATVRMKVKDAVRLMTGKLNPMLAFTMGKIKVEGDIQALMILQSIMR